MKTSTKTCIVDAELWLDYVEDHLEPSMRADLTLHVTHCEPCQKTLREFQGLRHVLDKKDSLPGDDFFAHLEGKIMAKVTQNEIMPPPTFRPGNRRTAYVTMALALVVVTSSFVVNKFGASPRQGIPVVQAEPADQMFIQTSANDIALVNDVINAHEGFEEVVFDAAAHRMAEMDESQARRTLGL